MTDGPLLAGKQLSQAMEETLTHAPLTCTRLTSSPEPRVMAATSALQRPCAGEGWVAIGDAALARDPLCGEGIASALRSGWDGGGHVLDALAGNPDVWRESARRVEATAQRYANEWKLAYQAQPRWSDRPFWAARTRL